jgi:type IV pilus assembly protein PilA
MQSARVLAFCDADLPLEGRIWKAEVLKTQEVRPFSTLGLNRCEREAYLTVSRVVSWMTAGTSSQLNKTGLGDRMSRTKKGFTLIELLIVVVIIGILAAIAIPKFANTKDKAYVAAMKSDLRNLATYEEQYAADQNGAYFTGNGTSQGFTPSQNVQVLAADPGTVPPTWTATAWHTQSAKVCDNSSGAIVCQ